jgi:hypothetical protein
LKSLDEQVMEWKVTYLRHEAFARDWEQVKQSAVHSLELLENKKISFAHGSIALMECPVKYDPLKIQERLGMEVLYRTAKVDCERVEEFAAKVFLNISEVQAFRTLKDLQEQYMLTTIEKQAKQIQYWDLRTRHMSELSQGR